MQLINCRKKVDKIDIAIVKLLAKRFRYADKNAFYKLKHDMSVYQLSRETEKKDLLHQMGKKYNIDPVFLCKMWDYIMSESIKRQEKIIEENKNKI